MIDFCPPLVIFALRAPGSGYGSTDLIASGSNPNPKHRLQDVNPFFFLFINWCGAGARTPATGGRSAARRHTAVRAEDVITALNLAPLIEEEAEQQGTVNLMTLRIFVPIQG